MRKKAKTTYKEADKELKKVRRRIRGFDYPIRLRKHLLSG